MRWASAFLCPWLVIGSVPPLDSITISDQIIPVEICTEATCAMAMLSSLLPKKRGFTRLTCRGFTTIRVGKNKLPLVQRLAVKISSGVAFVINADCAVGTLFERCYTHSRAPLPQIQM